MLVDFPGCGAPLGAGGHCAICGIAYVNQPATPPPSAAAWAAERRRQLAEWHSLIQADSSATSSATQGLRRPT